MKKLIVMCLSICLCMGLLPQQIHAQDDKTKQEPAQNAQDRAPSAKEMCIRDRGREACHGTGGDSASDD